MSTRQAASLDPAGLVAWIFVMRVFHSLIRGPTPAKPFPFLFSTAAPCQCTRTYVDVRAALLIHGFTGTPYEVRPLAEHLAGRGLEVATPVLPGHGQDAAALNRTTWRDW